MHPGLIMSRSGCDRPHGHFAKPQIVTTRKLPNPLTLMYSSACSDISIFPKPSSYSQVPNFPQVVLSYRANLQMSCRKLKAIFKPGDEAKNKISIPRFDGAMCASVALPER